MAVTVGTSAGKVVKAAIVAALRGSGVKTLAIPTGLSALAYAVEVHGTKPERVAYPFVRVDLGPEVPNSTMGKNGKKVGVWLQIFDDYQGDDRILDIQPRLMALLNPVGNYAALSVSGYRTEIVDWQSTDPQETQDDGAGRPINQSTVKFDVWLQES